MKDSGKAVIANMGGTAFGDIALVPGLNLKNPKGIRDVAEWYMSVIMRPDYIHEIFEKQSEIALSNLQKFYETVGNNIHAIFMCGTDFGTQDSQFCGLDTLEEMYLPYYKKLNDWIHTHTSWKTFKHSCGAVEPFINSFIDAGFDIINPVQINAKGMEPQHLKDAYGDRITFWGGGVDTQKVLSFGTPEDVKKQVLKHLQQQIAQRNSTHSAAHMAGLHNTLRGKPPALDPGVRQRLLQKALLVENLCFVLGLQAYRALKQPFGY